MAEESAGCWEPCSERPASLLAQWAFGSLWTCLRQLCGATNPRCAFKAKVKVWPTLEFLKKIKQSKIPFLAFTQTALSRCFSQGRGRVGWAHHLSSCWRAVITLKDHSCPILPPLALWSFSTVSPTGKRERVLCRISSQQLTLNLVSHEKWTPHWSLLWSLCLSNSRPAYNS